MKRRKFLQQAAVGGLLAPALAAPAVAQGEPTVRWRLAASWPKSLDTLFGSVEDLRRRVSQLTEKRFEIQPAAYVMMMAKYDARNPQALRRLVAAGVQLRQFPRPVLDACYKATFETYDELAAKSEDFRSIYASWQKFLDESNLWFRLAENNLDNYRYIMSAQR
jgi:TRAP-type mannitol/chloroaromatic compound transport system substrate-binding protein